LRESGAIEQDADTVSFIYRPAYYKIEETDDGKSTTNLGYIIIAKQRDGTLGDIPFSHNDSLTKIYEIKADAKEHEKEDQAEKELADKINKGDSVIFTTERTMEEQKDKISDDDKKTLNGLIEKMKSAVKDKNGDEIDKVEKDINDVWNKLAETLYKPSNASNGTSEQKSEESSSEVNEDTKDTAQDAEFEEVK
jgi:molecular chaperone DnaK (HSP70)